MAEAERILSQNEVDALLSAIDSGSGASGPVDSAAAYDFRHPPRLGPEGLRVLERLHEGFARDLQSALAGLLRVPAEVRVAGVHALSIREGLNSIPRPTALVVLSCGPLDGTFVLDVNPSIAAPVIERLLGSGKAGPPSEVKPLTALEWGAFETFLAVLLDLLRKAWAPLGAISFRVLRRESDPGALQLPRVEEPGIMVVLEAIVDEQKGNLDILFPLHAVENLLPGLRATALPSRRTEAEGEFPGRISPALVAVSAQLPTQTLRVEDIRNLKPGDLIVSGHPAAAPVLVSVEGVPKFRASLGRLKDHRAAKIAGELSPEEAAGRSRGTLIRAEPGESTGEAPAVEAILAVPLAISVVLAEKRAKLQDLVSLRPGDLVEFERRADAPLELRVSGRRIAEGSAVQVGERFGIKVTAIADPPERVRALGTGIPAAPSA